MSSHKMGKRVEVDMFYDLNLSVDGEGDQSRREMVAMAMRLGYSGVAANHTFTGVMADSDRCKFRPLEIKIVLAAAPGVAEAAKFHREVLGVAPESPFRQFSRITVVLDNPSQANSINSGNPVLKTYDLVAVRPMNQKSFNHACSQLEVDLISLDLSRRLPFRFKMHVVKAAIERGIYFEISYGRAICDPKARKDLFANAQILQSAARGRNIIVSSGAQRALEMRGPNDAANMATLFGLTLESAKASVSRNCKSVLLHGVSRKAAYRAAIHIDRTIAERNPNPDNLFSVPTDWDPLSLGGASSDFIPTDEPVGITIVKDPPAISKSRNIETTKWAVVISQELENQLKSEDVPKQSKNNVCQPLPGSVKGLTSLTEEKSVRDGQNVKAKVSEEHLRVSLAKSSSKGKNNKPEPSLDNLGQKRGKKRKRKNNYLLEAKES